ncbi:MAG: hypothetical protein WBQ29_17720 [Isosphaeraceae bacterium]
MSVSANMIAEGELRLRLDRIQSRALAAGGLGVFLSLAAWGFWPEQFLQHFLPSYLVAYVFWVGLALGCMGLTMLHHLVGGSWGLVVRRPMESGGMTLLPLALLFVPLALGLSRLYPWARPAEVAHDPQLQHKSLYLNVGFYLVRTVGYFVIWFVLTFVLNRLSSDQDRRADHRPSGRLQRLSGPGLVLLFLTGTFSAIDWLMSLEPHWSSTIYGCLVIVGEALATLAMMIAVVVFLSADQPMAEAATPDRLNDLGNLMLAFTMLWAYMSFMQYLIIWSGNLPEEIPWYLRRTRGGWQWVALALSLFHFFLPFFVLLFRENKRQSRLIVQVAILVLAMHWVDLIWLVVPASSDPASPRIPWVELPLSLVAMLGIGGFCTAFFIGHLKGRPLIPLNDPHLNEVIEHAGGLGQR